MPPSSENAVERQFLFTDTGKLSVFLEGEGRMQTITVCGSMRFEEEMKNIAFLLESKKGFNVIQCTYNEQKVEITAQMMENLKKAHFEKIKMSDGIYVVDIDHYIGSSVQQEIEYAKKMNKQIILHSDYFSTL